MCDIGYPFWGDLRDACLCHFAALQDSSNLSSGRHHKAQAAQVSGCRRFSGLADAHNLERGRNVLIMLAFYSAHYWFLACSC